MAPQNQENTTTFVHRNRVIVPLSDDRVLIIDRQDNSGEIHFQLNFIDTKEPGEPLTDYLRLAWIDMERLMRAMRDAWLGPVQRSDAIITRLIYLRELADKGFHTSPNKGIREEFLTNINNLLEQLGYEHPKG
jgi:hypothetical protein